MAKLPVSTSGARAIDIAREAAIAGGRLARARFGAAHRIESKGRGNVVTETDVEVELLIKERIARAYPDHAVLSEETASGTDASHGWCWVIDPIDGTKNYAQGIPIWCTTVALCCDGEPLAGVTYDAMRDECFHAVKDEGAWLGEQRLSASGRPDVASSVIGVDLGYDDALGAAQIALIARIFPRVQSVRILGSAALGVAYAASGRLDAFTHLNVYPWDIAAGILLVREAGGVISDRSGGPATIATSAFVAGGRDVHGDFIARYAPVQGGAPG